MTQTKDRTGIMPEPARTLFRSVLESRLAKKQLVYILLFSSVVTLVMTFIQLFVEYRDDIQSLDSQLAQIESSHLESLTNSLWMLDNRQIEIQLADILALKDLAHVEITEKGKPLFSAGTRPIRRAKTVTFPMVHSRRGEELTIGHLTAAASLDHIYGRLARRLFTILATQALKTFLVSFFILVILYQNVIRHLLRLSGFTQNLRLDSLTSDFSLDRPLSPVPDELDHLVNQFNHMRSRLNADLDMIRKTEQALRRSEERFELAMKFANEGLFDWDLKTGQVYFSPGWKRLAGYQDHELENTLSQWERLTRPGEIESAWTRLKEVLSGQRDRFETVFKIRHKDGHWVDVLSRANVIFDDSGKGIRVVGTHVDITDLKQAQENLRQSEQELKAILQATPDPMVRYDTQGCPLYINPEFTRVFGWSLAEVQGQIIPFVPESQRQTATEKIQTLYRTGKPVKFSGKRLTQKGDAVDVIISAALIRDDAGNASGMVVNLTDIREQKKLEAQLQQAQKMEAVGRLAGGVAHDFNNMLSIIMGHTEILLEDTLPDSPFHLSVLEIQNAAQRSTDLVRQLLAFARKQTIAPLVLDLNRTTQGMLKMLQRLIGEDIRLIWKPSDPLWPVKVDPSQIDQILVNLCVNARDAIRGTGEIRIETRNLTLDPSDMAAVSGDYVMLVFSDSGCGMDKKTLDNIFEPFFTTKGMGRGTGLGLATIYGIVRQNKGVINVCSEPGQGTTFRICFPRFNTSEIPRSEAPDPTPVQGGDETILLVEDEEAMLKVTSTLLEKLGYRVLTASSPGEALTIAAKGENIHLLMTDVVMPDMNGRELAEQVLLICPAIRCLYMSGYTANIIAHHGILDEDVVFISKPFSVTDIAAKVRHTLDAG